MTNREQIIFDALLKESDELKKIDPFDVTIIQMTEDILIWWKDPKDNLKLKLVRVHVEPSSEIFIRESISKYRDKKINQLIL
jgi:hypothetical protein